MRIKWKILISALQWASISLLFSSAWADVGGHFPDPEDGAVHDGVYVNEYFGFRYPLPPDWTEDVKGPVPSSSGFYSLISLKPAQALTATALITAQDDFFSPEKATSAMEFVTQMKNGLDDSFSAPDMPKEVQIAGHSFVRFEYTGAALYHAIFATEIRCNTVIFSFTSGDRDKIRELTDSLEKISFMSDARAKWPVCIANYAAPAHVTHELSPVQTGPRFATVPVRIIIDPQGRVEHVHAIAGFPDQVKSVQAAISQWQFKPYEVNGHAVEIETGLLVQFGRGTEASE